MIIRQFIWHIYQLFPPFGLRVFGAPKSSIKSNFQQQQPKSISHDSTKSEWILDAMAISHESHTPTTSACLLSVGYQNVNVI